MSAELLRRGHQAVDADAAFAYFGDPATGRPSSVRIRDHWIWDVPRLRAFCAEHERARQQTQQHDDWLCVCGGALNQDQVAELFTLRFTLWVDDATMRHRLTTRPDDGYGHDQTELAEQLVLNRTYATEAQRRGSILIDARRPIGGVAETIVSTARQSARRPRPPDLSERS